MKKIFVLVMGLAMAGCMSDGHAQNYKNTTTVWHLTSVNGKAMTGPAMLKFTENGIAGQGTCNRFRAEQTAEYPDFEAGPVAATKRACLHPMGDETEYFQTLEKVNSASMTDDTLVLNGPDGSELIFTAGK